MGLIQYYAMVFLLYEMCDIAVGVDDFTVQFESQQTCFEENTDISIVVNYTGAGTPGILQWKFSKVTDPAKTLDIVITGCQAVPGADDAFPLARMSYTCDDTLKKYTTNISSFSEATDAGTWEVAVSVSNVFTNFKNVTVKKCAATTGGNTGGLSTWAKIGIGCVVVVVVGTVATIAVVKLKKMGKLPGNKPGRYHPTNNSHGDKPSNKK